FRELLALRVVDERAVERRDDLFLAIAVQIDDGRGAEPARLARAEIAHEQRPLNCAGTRGRGAGRRRRKGAAFAHPGLTRAGLLNTRLPRTGFARPLPTGRRVA